MKSKLKYDDLNMIFSTAKAHWVRDGDGDIIGKGCLQSDLEAQGFSRKELRQLVHQAILQQHQVSLNGTVYNSFVIPLEQRNGLEPPSVLTFGEK